MASNSKWLTTSCCIAHLRTFCIYMTRAEWGTNISQILKIDKYLQSSGGILNSTCYTVTRGLKLPRPQKSVKCSRTESVEWFKIYIFVDVKTLHSACVEDVGFECVTAFFYPCVFNSLSFRQFCPVYFITFKRVQSKPRWVRVFCFSWLVSIIHKTGACASVII
jgi:hypothetical protein